MTAGTAVLGKVVAPTVQQIQADRITEVRIQTLVVGKQTLQCIFGVSAG